MSKELENILAPLLIIIEDIFKISHITSQMNFFELDGDSLLAIQLCHRLNHTFDIYLPVSEILNAKTFEELARSIEATTTKNIVIPKVEGLPHYPLSFAQERLWFIEQYEQGSNIYHLPLLLQLNNAVSLKALKQAIQAIGERHEILRSVLTQDELGIHYQMVRDESLDIKTISCQTKEEYQQFITEDINRPFDLRQAYPVRICLYEVSESNYLTRYLLFNFHHIASDGWSINILRKELTAYYEYYDANVDLSLPILPVQYKDFAVWQRHYVSNKILAKQLDYWRSRLADYEILQLPIDKKRPAQVSYEGDMMPFSLSEELSNKLRMLSRVKGHTLYTVLLAGFYVLLYKYSGQEDLIVGSPTANRHYEPIKDLIGFFVNMLIQREQLDVNQPITFLIEQIHQHLSEAQCHQDIPFEKLVQELTKERDLSRHPLFQVLFTVQNFDPSFNHSSNTLFSPVSTQSIHAITHFDLRCTIDGSQSSLTGHMLYANRLYYPETIQRFIHHYINILNQMVDEPNKLLREYQVLSPQEYQHLIYDWNNTTQAYPGNKTLHQLFEEQVVKTPDNIALVYENLSLTYFELNQRANQLAHYLQMIYNIQRDDLIALCLERSEYMLIAILGVLKAGAAYVPIDPSCPSERIHYILQDTQARTMISQTRYQKKLDWPTLIIDSEKLGVLLSQQSSLNPISVTKSHHLAYVIYTSGTTGHPKGVMLEHRNVINYVYAIIDQFALSEKEHHILLQEYVFDSTVTSIYGSLLCGGKLFLLPQQYKNNVEYVSRYLVENHINFIKSTPSYLDIICLDEKIFIDYCQHNSVKIVLGGEAVSYKTLQKVQYLATQGQVVAYNHYGPTEITVGSSACNINTGNLWELFQMNPIIGKSLPNYMAYIVDNNGQPLPIGAVGELMIGGAGVARGYLNQPELSAKKFIVNPFQTQKEKVDGKNVRLYKTGDLARYLPNGNIEYIGRNDTQVKIRGFRIELSEIENQLSAYSGIKQAIVLAPEDSQQILIAYYIADEKMDESKLLHHLEKQLPDYMLPHFFVHLTKLPLTLNGKLDRKALPMPVLSPIHHYEAPRNALEKSLCTLYAEILNLNVEQVGIRDDFFRLGGNSLLTIQTVHRLNKILNIQLPVAELFHAKTPEQLALSIEKISQNAPDNTEELTSEQLWIIEQESILNFEAYNTVIDDFLITIRDEGSKPPLFIVPGGWGEKNELLIFIVMSLHLDPERPIYGIRSRVMDPNWTLPKTLHEQAQAVFNSIKKIQPRGPYHFLGECIAGKLAVELAGLAEKQGEKPGITILLDSHINKSYSFDYCTASERPQAITKYYHLLHSATPAPNKSKFHLLLSSDRKNPKETFNTWKAYFKKKSRLYLLNATHSTYVRQESAETVKIINKILAKPQFNLFNLFDFSFFAEALRYEWALRQRKHKKQ